MKITDHIHMLTIPFTVPAPAGPIARSVNIFLIVGDKITLIDSGVAGSEKVVAEYLQRIGREPKEIDTLILTHSHPDHIGAARAIHEVTGCRIVAHAAEMNWIENTELQERNRPVPGFKTLVQGSVVIDKLLDDGEVLSAGDDAAMEVLHTPGHSGGSISLWVPNDRVLITADAVPMVGEMPIFDDYAAALASLLRLQEMKADILLSAWDLPRQGEAVDLQISSAISWLRRINEAVHSLAAEREIVEPMELCRLVTEAMGLPPFAVNPLVARSFMACLGQENIS